MENETQQTEQSTQQTTQTTEKEVTLDDVYRESGLDKIQATTQTEQPVRQQEVVKEEPKIEPSSIPDAYDSENFKAYMARRDAGTNELHKAVVAMAQHMTAEQQKAALALTRADIESAVKSINEIVGHPKEKVIEAALDGAVRDNPQLKAIWDNRGKNPAAWTKALNIVTKQISEDFSMKVDPKLVEAQRARKESQKQMATTSREDDSNPLEDRLGKAQGVDFDLEWQRLVSGGSN